MKLREVMKLREDRSNCLDKKKLKANKSVMNILQELKRPVTNQATQIVIKKMKEISKCKTESRGLKKYDYLGGRDYLMKRQEYNGKSSAKTHMKVQQYKRSSSAYGNYQDPPHRNPEHDENKPAPLGKPAHSILFQSNFYNIAQGSELDTQRINRIHEKLDQYILSHNIRQ